MAKNHQLLAAKNDVIENLDVIQSSLVRCVAEGMIDLEDSYYNETLDLIEDAQIVSNWDELMEIISKGKTLEVDVAAWLARHGRTSLSLTWPKYVS